MHCKTTYETKTKISGYKNAEQKENEQRVDKRKLGTRLSPKIYTKNMGTVSHYMLKLWHMLSGRQNKKENTNFMMYKVLNIKVQ